MRRAVGLGILVLAACGEEGAPGAAEEPARGPAVEARAGGVHDQEACTVRAEELRARVAALELELQKERAARLDRERDWLHFTRGLAQLESLASPPRFEPDVPGENVPGVDARLPSMPAAASVLPAPEEPARELARGPAPADDLPAPARPPPNVARDREVYLALRSLFAIEHVSGLDLLESGSLHAGATGPVVLRVLDAEGRPLGSLSADRLRLTGSRAARTLTLILESGWERRAGVKTPFEGGPPGPDGRGGIRRIELPHVDPTPWFEALPELFGPEEPLEDIAPTAVPLHVLRFELNRLLRTDAAGSVHRLDEVRGVQGATWRDVRLTILDADGRAERELFADRMSILRAEQGLEILLEEGSQVRGSEKAPFLEGRYRIFLPRAAAAAWEKAGIPLAQRAPAGG